MLGVTVPSRGIFKSDCYEQSESSEGRRSFDVVTETNLQVFDVTFTRTTAAHSFRRVEISTMRLLVVFSEHRMSQSSLSLLKPELLSRRKNQQ